MVRDRLQPSQVAFAQALAAASGVAAQGTRLLDEAFADFCQRTDLPDFSFIGIHGIWSWISDANRAVLVDFVRRKLRVGGVLYISYNTQPGWAAMAPMRDLLVEHAQVMGAPGHGIASRIDASLAFADRLMATNPRYAQANTQIAARLKALASAGRNYLAHEYFNRDWQPMAFADMARWLEPAKLGYGCSAHYQDHLSALNLTPAQSAFLQEQPDPMFRETVRDFLVNQQFRRDYWIKGPRRLATPAQHQALKAQRVMLVVPPSDVVRKVKSPIGESTLTAAVYDPMLAAMADQQPLRIGDVWERLQTGPDRASISFAQLIEATLLLCSKGDVAAVQDEAVLQKAKPLCQRLNRHILGLARNGGDVGYLASPVSGGGAMLGRIQMLCLLAMDDGKTPMAAPDIDVLAGFAWDTLLAQGQRMLRDGKPMESAEENMAELRKQAAEFVASRLPALHQLQVLD